MDEWAYGRNGRNGRMDEWVNGWIDGWMNEGVDGCMSKRTDRIDERVGECMN